MAALVGHDERGPGAEVKLLWSKKALARLGKIRARIGEGDPGAAERVARRLLESADRLIDFPRLGRARLDGTRELVVMGTRYLLVYRIRDDHIAIAAVMHHAQERY